MQLRAGALALCALLALGAACRGSDSTLALDVTIEPVQLPVATVQIEVRQGARSIVQRDFGWQRDRSRLGLFLPADVSGEVLAIGRGLAAGGAVLATGEGRAQVSPGKVTAPLSLVLRAVAVWPPDGGPPAGGGSPDAGADSALADAPADAPLPEGGPPDSAPEAAPTAPTDPPRPLRPFNGEATGSVFAPAALRPRFQWVPARGATSYDIEIDGSCLPETLASCPFSSPEVRASVPGPSFAPAAPLDVARTPPVGRRYAWRVRGCNGGGCGPWSAVRYVDVGRQTRDFNGDGYADVFVEADGGPVVFLGGPALDTKVDLQITVDSPLDVFIAAAGDTNGDGFADLLVGQPAAGKVSLYLGGATLHATPDVTITGSPDDAFGAVVAGAGDVDGDGFADLLVAAPSGKPPSVHLVRGSRQGTLPAITLTLASADQFGRAVSSAGDMNGDGYADIAVATAFTTTVFFGGAAFDTSPDMVYTAFPRVQEGLAPLGDIDGDGYADLVIVAPQVVVRRGGSALVDDGIRIMEAGWSASGGDVNGDGLADLLLRGIHSSALLYLGGKPWDAGPTLELKGPVDETYAASVSVVGDLDGDGFGDLLVGGPERVVAGQAVGAVDLFLGGAIPDARVDQSFPGPRTGGFFGGLLAWLPRSGGR